MREVVVQVPGLGAAEGNVAQFAPGAGAFAIEMQVRSGDGKHCWNRRQRPNQVEHDGIAARGGGTEWKTSNGAEVIFKLAALRAFNGPVAGIMNPWGHFIGKQPPFTLKEFNRQHPNIVERFEDGAGILLGLKLETGRDGCGRPGEVQDTIPVLVFNQGIKGDLPVPTADGKDRKLPVKGHSLF